MTPFHTVKEAARITGKSPSSIRRVIYPIIHDDQHADRAHIQPSVEDARALRIKGENFAWRISEELLRREVPVESAAEKGSDKAGARSLQDSEAELLSMLRRELDIKNQQITQHAEMLSRQMELINGLTERLREGNVLIGSLQQQLALGDGSARMKSQTVDAEIQKPKAAESHAAKSAATKVKAGEPSAKANPKAVKPKRGFFQRIFG